jgi:hypothetical protein
MKGAELIVVVLPPMICGRAVRPPPVVPPTWIVAGAAVAGMGCCPEDACAVGANPSPITPAATATTPTSAFRSRLAPRPPLLPELTWISRCHCPSKTRAVRDPGRPNSPTHIEPAFPTRAC